MSEERFIDIETRLAHQDQMLGELNEVVTQQQERIMLLEDLCKSLIQRVQSAGEGVASDEPGDNRPPHY